MTLTATFTKHFITGNLEGLTYEETIPRLSPSSVTILVQDARNKRVFKGNGSTYYISSVRSNYADPS